jgi:RHS repeat-associated protein
MDSVGVVRTGQRLRKHFDVADQVREQWSENGPGGGGIRVSAETLQVQTVFDAGGLPLSVHRRSIPDSNSIGWVVDSRSYDALARDTLDSGPATLHKRYDLAGNVVWTSRGDSSVYDANSRLIKHLLPSVHWLRRDTTSINVERDSAAADTETFTYGISGRLLAADNRYARVHRGYFRNGALHADTTLQQDYALDGTWTSVAISHGYDLEGRPVVLHHGLTGPHDIRYAYDPGTGALSTVIDAQDSTFVYTYDASGRLTALKYPGGTENYQYDPDSRLTLINGDSLQRDARGKVIQKTSGTSASLYTMNYSPLGNLVQLIRGPGVESYTPDALGNNKAVSISGTDGGPFGPKTDGDWKRIYNPARGTLVFASKVRDDSPHLGEYLPDGEWSYDGFGNQFQSTSYAYRLVNFSNGMGPDSLVADTTNSWSSYDGNNHLRHVFSTTRQVYTSGMVVTDSVRMRSHEYRYDALGRRIMARYRGPYECQYTNSTDCRGTLDWQVWNGDELLCENRTVENGLPPGTANFDGTVVYTNGARLDVPLSITRSSASSSCDFTIAPHADWRGHLTSGTFIGAPPSCANVVWPGNDMTAYRQGPASDKTNPWNGSIIDQGGDQSGLQYMRNRYFDPASGQFTQADPIGLAGGLNSYGYANGDPVTYSDPFGLMGCQWHDVACWDDLMLASSGGTGVTGRVLAPLASTLLDVSGALAVDEHAKEAAAGDRLSGVLLVADIAVAAVPGGEEGGRALAKVGEELAERAGSNSVSLHSAEGIMRVDLVGRAHGGVPTPHVQTYRLHANPQTGVSRLSRDQFRAATMEDLRTVRRYLDRLP